MAKKTPVKKESRASKSLPYLPFVIGGAVLLIVVASIVAINTSSPKLTADEMFAAAEQTVVKWYNESTLHVTLQEEGFVDGMVERKVRSGDPSVAYSFVGAYTFESERKASQFYASILQKDPLFSNETVAVDTSKVQATCKGYHVKQILVAQLPPINAVHIVCQKEYAVIEVLVRTYKVDGTNVANQIAYLLLKNI